MMFQIEMDIIHSNLSLEDFLLHKNRWRLAM